MKRIISTLAISVVFASFINNAYAGYFLTDAKRACPQMITSFLTSGNTSDEVLFMQNELNKEGYFREVPNGYFDNSTIQALTLFQRDNNLLQTGKVGQYTMDSLNQRICGFSSSNNGSVVGMTVVDPIDPFVKIVNAESDKYVANQNSTQAGSFSNNSNTNNQNINNSNIIQSFAVTTPATLIDQSTTNTSVFYNPAIGYTYGITPKSGSVTVTSPPTNSVFNEGDTVNISWFATNLNVSNYQVLLENTITGESKELVVTSSNNARIVLTKEILDSVCSSVCDDYKQANFNIAIVTPVKDTTGNVSNLKARVFPVMIKRNISILGNANISASKTPVNSGEIFKLYINASNPVLYSNQINKYSLGVSAICPSGVSVSVGGMNCGQEFSMPQTSNYTQNEIPVKVTNNGWFTQSVIFNLGIYNEVGKLISVASTTVDVSPAPKSI